MIDAATLLTIVLMAGVTYLTRIGGYVVLRNRVLSPRATAVMEAAPGCVLISVIAPAFVSRNPADLAALAITLVAATRLSMLPTVLIGVASASLLRHLIG
ncbi:AzlD family protein [Mesorhizobium sp. CO1-1-7]|uniref:Putative membrane protein n=1 Tax=Mesorhizobium australicum (strain HAMBI 3006 / LMG 24608 / WSM2073) TaxID=754035 RepID=L0KL51_MESAW|nr:MULTISPECIES: AzlD family protein [Mesorhizobium]MBZ9933321.1 AzlD family protein [Mesorhizobium sp. BR1-1-5]AGB44783.1 putative membrane protein [Mesorhizobium australicum WSM2073]MBZ9727872.1 AzlD family protein [Mesorhizobium sp. CO1-1-11]MBZ9749108.1 AzlD family protein [Mesorhizobium sp. CO1-1-7]MBZ9906176.1 AzlD family protein [Mesorhizobium sp. BR115XR7A]